MGEEPGATKSKPGNDETVEETGESGRVGFVRELGGGRGLHVVGWSDEKWKEEVRC
jgi:hypothetical protein